MPGAFRTGAEWERCHRVSVKGVSNRGERMSKHTTALVMVGPAGVGPFRSPDWRVSMTAQLIEGGSSGPVWMTSPGGHHDEGIAPESMLIDGTGADLVARSLVLLIAASIGDEVLRSRLADTGNVELDEHRMAIADPWLLPDDLLHTCTTSLSARCRIGIVRLEERPSLDSLAASLLRDWGFDVDEFTQVPA